jgi:hypothetical protein
MTPAPCETGVVAQRLSVVIQPAIWARVVLVGCLFWASNLATLIGSLITGAIPDAAGALTSFYPHQTQIVVGTLINHINEGALIAYAVALFPVLRRFGDGQALAYVAFKLVEGVLLLVGAALLLSLIPLSQTYLQGHATDGSALPRFIAIWGWIAVAMLAAGLAAGVGSPTSGFQPGQVLVIPIILWELVFATWLIVRGFDPAALAARPLEPVGRALAE